MSDDPYAEILKGYSPSSQPSTDPYSEILSGYGQPKSTRGVADYKPRTLSTGNPQYDTWYDTYGKKHNVDPDLLIAQGKQESGFRKGAKSSAGAQGIAQFMPATAKEFGVDVNSPESSISGQALLMSKLLDRTKDPALALAGYNSGHNASIQRLQRNLKRIPETRGYANNILGMYNKTTKPSQDKGNSSDPYASILSGYKPDVPPSTPPPTNPANVMPQPQTLPTPMGVNDQLQPQGLSTQPVPETPDTIKAQMQAALNPKVKDRAAVLTTDPSQNAIFGNSGFIPITVQQGTLWVNPAKARKLKLRTRQDIDQFVKANPDGMTRLIGKVENVGDNTGGNQPVVQTVAPDGTELSSSVVTNPETAAKQVDVDKQSFPDSRTQVTTTNKVAQERQNALKTPPNAQKQYAVSDAQIGNENYDPVTGELIPDLTQQSNLRNAQVSTKDAGSTIADKIDIPDNIKTADKANAYVKSYLQAKYPNADFSGFKWVDNYTPGMGAVVDFNSLKKAGVDTDSILAQKVAENRVENPQADLRQSPIQSWIDPDKASANIKKAFADLPGGDYMASAAGGFIGGVGGLDSTMAGLLTLVNDLSPTKGESIPESLLQGGVKDADGNPVPIQKVREDSIITTLRDFGNAAEETQQKTRVLDANGEETLPSMLVQIAGRAPGDLVKLGIMSQSPGGIVLAMALDSTALARLHTKDPKQLLTAAGKGAALGAIFGVAGTAGKIATDVTGTVLNKAISPLFTKGAEMATIGGGSYTIGTAFGDPTKEKLQSAFVNSIFHIIGGAGKKAEGKTFRMVDEDGNVIAGKVEDGKVVAVDPKEPVNVEMYLPRKAKVTETTLKPIDTKGENPETNTAIPQPKSSLGTEPLVQDTQVERRAEDRRQQATKDYENDQRLEADRREEDRIRNGITPQKVRNLADGKDISEASINATVEKVTGKKSLDDDLTKQELLDVSEAIGEGKAVPVVEDVPEKGFEMKPAESEPENITTNASGESAASQEAINRFASEKRQGLTRVVVDTRKPNAEPRILTDAQAVDYKPSPYESVEYRGGDRNGEVIAQGNDVRPNYSPPSRIEGETVAPKKIEEVTPDTHEIKDEGTSLKDLEAELKGEKPAKEPSQMTRDEYRQDRQASYETNRAKQIAELEQQLKDGTFSKSGIGHFGTQKTLSDAEARAQAESRLADLKKGSPDWLVESEADHSHKIHIQDAIAEGKSVPPEVLADYPDLAKEYDAKVATQKQVADIANSIETKPPMKAAEEIITNDESSRKDTQNSSANERTPEARPNSESGTSDTAIKTEPVKRTSESVPSKVNAEGVTAEKPVKESGNDGGKLDEAGTKSNAPEVAKDLELFKNNKIVSADRVAQLRAEIAKRQGKLTSGIDPVDLALYTELGAAYIEAGARKFADFSKRMIDELGDEIKPHLDKIYGNIRQHFDLEGMTPDNRTPLKEGEGIAKVGKSIQQKALEQGLVDEFSDTAKYDVKGVKEQAQKVSEIVTNDQPRTMRIIRGEEALPESINRAMFIDGVERSLKEMDDVKAAAKIATDLMNSPLVTETSKAAQTLRFLQEREPDSVTAYLKQIQDARKERAMRQGVTKEDTKALDEKIADLEKRLAEKQKADIDKQFEQFINEVKNDQATAKKKGGSVVDYFNELEAKARARIEKRGESAIFRSSVAPIDPQMLADHAIIGAAHIARGIKKGAEFTDAMVKQFGDKIRPYIDDLWDASDRFYKANAIKSKADLTPEQIIAASDGVDKKLINSLVTARIKQGDTSADRVFGEVTKDIQSKYPEVSEQEIRDTFTGYGETKVPKRNDLLRKRNEIQRLQKLQSQIDDINAGKQPWRPERKEQTKSEYVKAKERELEQAMAKAGITMERTLTDAERLAARKRAMQRELGKIESALASGNYEKPTRRITILDSEGQKIQSELQKARDARNALGHTVNADEAETLLHLLRAVDEGRKAMEAGGDRKTTYGAAQVALDNYVNDLKLEAKRYTLADFKKNPAGAVAKLLNGIASNTKAIAASMDDSAVFRQGWKTMFTHPTIWAKNGVKTFAHLIKMRGQHEVMDALNADIVSRPTYELMKKAKLDIGVNEETFPTTLPEHIPVVGRVYKATENAYTAFVRKTRADVFDKYIDIANKTGLELTDTELKGIGRMVNSLTGRGDLGTLEQAGKVVNNVFFSPKFLKSHFDVLGGHVLTGGGEGSAFVRKQAAINLVKVVGGTAAILLIAKAINPDAVDLDPRSADFGKIRVNNTTFDVSGGMGSILTLAGRLALSQTKSSVTGKVYSLNETDQKGNLKFGAQTRFDVLVDFLANKTSPIAHVLIDYAKGQTFDREKPTIAREGMSLITPLPLKTGQELWKDPHSAPFLVGLIADIMGISTNTYGGSKGVVRDMNKAKARGDFAEVERLKPILAQELEIEKKQNEQRRQESGTPPPTLQEKLQKRRDERQNRLSNK